MLVTLSCVVYCLFLPADVPCLTHYCQQLGHTTAAWIPGCRDMVLQARRSHSGSGGRGGERSGEQGSELERSIDFS